ncbi:MAG: MATE family efflux transporter, partial [Acutalibacteraceae bacterium]
MNDEKKLGTEKIGKLMLSMGVPTLTAQLINLLYNIVDRIYIGHIPNVGADALTGLGLTMPVIMIISAFSMLLGAGGAPLAGIDMGRGDMKSAEKIIGSCAGALVICSVILTAAFAVFRKPLLYIIGASDVTLPYAMKYLSIYLCGTLFVQLTLGLNLFLTAQGKAKTAMLSVLIGAVINIILDPVLIFALDMGISGAALATVFSQFCSCVWVVKSLTGKKTALRIKKENLKPDPAVL